MRKSFQKHIFQRKNFCIKATSLSKSKWNDFNIQLLPESIHKVLFKHVYHPDFHRSKEKEKIKEAIDSLKEFNLDYKNNSELPKVDIKLPDLEGDNIDEHFKAISRRQYKIYFDNLSLLVKSNLPPLPTVDTWVFEEGWMKYLYDAKTKKFVVEKVVCPDADAYVFDCEVLVQETKMPVIAVAASSHSWYTWTCKALKDDSKISKDKIEDLIPLQGDQIHQRLVVGHNVSYDRARIKEEYDEETGGLRFVDTMSLHISIAGFNNDQKLLYKKQQPELEKTTLSHRQQLAWQRVGSTNSLADIYKFYCHQKLDKSVRDTFVKGSFEDVRKDLPELMHYCAKDVLATYRVLQVLFPRFCDRFPHPVTFAGLLIMSKMYLPVKPANWFLFNKQCDDKYEDLVLEMENYLVKIAEEACSLKDEDQYKDDLWLYDLDWDTKDVKYLKNSSKLAKNQPKMVGKPNWFRDLHVKNPNGNLSCKITASMRITPKLLKLTWLKCPLHFDKQFGWGYIQDQQHQTDLIQSFQLHTPAVKACKSVPDGCTFHRLPHPDGIGKNVGNPLSKGFLSYISDGTLESHCYDVRKIFEINKIISYWRSTRKRLRDQMLIPKGPQTSVIIPQVVVTGTVTRRAVEKTWLTTSNVLEDRIGSEVRGLVQAPAHHRFVSADVDAQECWIASILADSHYAREYGCTGLSWMTLQGSKSAGSDFHSVTAKAAGMDRNQAKIFNYARLYGSGQSAAVRSYQQHNKSLSLEECQQKISALYRMTKGVPRYKLTCFARDFIKYHRVTEFRVSSDGFVDLETFRRLLKLVRNHYDNELKITPDLVVEDSEWSGGVESFAYNKMKQICMDESPNTPVLLAKITRPLEPRFVAKNFMTSRMNWVVQSSAVDFLHLLLVAIEWLIATYHINARLVLTIHDEIHYLATKEDARRLALAFNIANLFTRSMFAYQLGFDDLPYRVAFFSEVSIDSTLRKRPDDDCLSPSNPLGLFKQYGIPHGQSFDIHQVLKQTSNDLRR